ncbi:hypothetical protein [Streptomyces sp. NPDC048272]|uniref:hypothetical protein n=1 Tax=Streptomyces sp. NPDC048272 TaxID=3154616 RepID=UPI003440043D
MARTYAPEDVVVTSFSDPGLPEGSRGIVKVVPDPVDGVDVQFAAGLFNIVASELEIAGRTG